MILSVESVDKEHAKQFLLNRLDQREIEFIEFEEISSPGLLV